MKENRGKKDNVKIVGAMQIIENIASHIWHESLFGRSELYQSGQLKNVLASRYNRRPTLYRYPAISIVFL